MADENIANRRPGQRVGEVDVLFTGNTEDTGDPFVPEALDEELSSAPSSLSHNTESTEPGTARKATEPVAKPDPVVRVEEE
jgi:hypothetical protein